MYTYVTLHLLCRYDSPANAMSHSLYELAKNPGAQQRLIAEVDILKGRQPEYDDLASLVYVEAAFQVGPTAHSTHFIGSLQ